MSLDLTVIDQFCGAGGSFQGIRRAGLTGLLAMNHNPVAIESHSANFPDVRHECEDVRKLDPSKFPRADILVTSPECFPAGTLILTSIGLLPIENVRVGDQVLTHRGRWRPVTATMRQKADTIIVGGMGHPGLEMTPNHPVWVWPAKRAGLRDDRHQCRYLVGAEPSWTPAGNLASGEWLWASPTNFGAPPTAIPLVGGRGIDFRLEFWWLVGRWLGDGVVRLRPRSSEVQIVCGKHEADKLARQLAIASPVGGRARGGELRWHRRELRTAIAFTTRHDGLANWLHEQFGQHAHGKRLPAWALAMPERSRCALLDGYVSADGNVTERITRASTVSRELAIGMRLLGESLGHATGLTAGHQGGDGIIEGRVVHQRPSWIIRWSTRGLRAHSKTTDLHRWLPIRSVLPGRTGVEVYNLTVADDESYVAEGIVVHNCKAHTYARGTSRRDQEEPLFESLKERERRLAAQRSRATMDQVIRWMRAHDYEAVIVENVGELVDWTEFDAWLREVDKLGYRVQFCWFNSMFFGGKDDGPHRLSRGTGCTWLSPGRATASPISTSTRVPGACGATGTWTRSSG
jgi:hypothetical protein